MTMNENGTSSKSRTARKRASAEIQEIGSRLIACSPETLQQMELPQEILDAVSTAKSIKKRGGLQRQRKLIGKLLRSEDVEPIRHHFAAIDRKRQLQADAFHEVERLRDQLLADNSLAMDTVLQRYPQCDRAKLTRLVLQAVLEREKGKGPRAGRLLFRYLRSLEEQIPSETNSQRRNRKD
ncbi:MAG: ribosome biogenesis factor YjgA [Desulfovibrionales bacterium]